MSCIILINKIQTVNRFMFKTITKRSYSTIDSFQQFTYKLHKQLTQIDQEIANKYNIEKLKYDINQLNDLNNDLKMAKQFRVNLIMIVRMILKTSQEITEFEEDNIDLTDDLIDSRQSQYSIFESQHTLIKQIQQLNVEQQKALFINFSRVELFQNAVKESKVQEFLFQFIRQYTDSMNFNNGDVILLIKNWSFLFVEMKKNNKQIQYKRELKVLLKVVAQQYKELKQKDKIILINLMKNQNIQDNNLFDKLKFDLLLNYKKYNVYDIYEYLSLLTKGQKDVSCYELIYKTKNELLKYLRNADNLRLIQVGLLVNVIKIISNVRNQLYLEDLREKVIQVLRQEDYLAYHMITESQLVHVLMSYSRLNVQDQLINQQFKNEIVRNLPTMSPKFIRLVTVALCTIRYFEPDLFNQIAGRVDLLRMKTQKREIKTEMQAEDADFQLEDGDLLFLEQVILNVFEMNDNKQ